jgi:HAD superfamily hydrolase (TIGR01509 family)
MPGALRLIKTLHGHRALAVASSSYERDVRCVLESVGITRFFDVLASKESAERLKPHPDIFLYVARRLSMPPAQCLVLEDAQKGVLAAHAAGMPCIAVPNEFTRDNDFSKATRVVDSLADVTPELIDSLSD